jgi:hypothetical protein
MSCSGQRSAELQTGTSCSGQRSAELQTLDLYL